MKMQNSLFFLLIALLITLSSSITSANEYTIENVKKIIGIIRGH